MCYINYCLFILCLITTVARSDRESECTEVGFARSAGSMIHQSFDSTRDTILAKWQEEDVSGIPKFKGLSSMLKNVTRTAEMLEESSKLLLSMIRKTRVGKRCPELWLLRGVEKHVVPLMNLDKDLSEELGLVMSFRCLVGSPYPNVDGTCINQESPDLGSIGSKFLRLLPATPGMDGFSLRSSVSSEKQLPTGRTVSNLIRKHMQAPAVTELFKQWAHFIQRDTFGIPESPVSEGTNCCEQQDHEDCAPIHIESNDADYKELKCINYRRAARAQAILGHRESMTVVSTYLDATPVYGSTNEVAFSKKAGFFGYLKVPEEEDEKKEKKSKCDFPNSFAGCFTEDKNKSLVPGLMYLLSLEHNRLADVLAETNSHFDDSLLYNEARRITIALYNTITFGEYLPALLGDPVVKQHHLEPGSEGPAAQFIPQVNPGILAAFAVAAYRNPAMYTEWRSDWGPTDLVDSAHYSSIEKDTYKDMLAMDIQRARDHAVPGYLLWRRFCDPGRPLDKWEDFEQILPKEFVAELRSVYQGEMEDIDMSAALLESPDDGALVGKTFSCIMADQYARLRTGNRLYWEHESAMFTEEQRQEIRKTTAAGLLCRNLPLEQVPKNPFFPVSDKNPNINCKDLSQLDMSHWKDTSLIDKMGKDNTGELEDGQSDVPEPAKVEADKEEEIEAEDSADKNVDHKNDNKHEEL